MKLSICKSQPRANYTLRLQKGGRVWIDEPRNIVYVPCFAKFQPIIIDVNFILKYYVKKKTNEEGGKKSKVSENRWDFLQMEHIFVFFVFYARAPLPPPTFYWLLCSHKIHKNSGLPCGCPKVERPFFVPQILVSPWAFNYWHVRFLIVSTLMEEIIRKWWKQSIWKKKTERKNCHAWKLDNILEIYQYPVHIGGIFFLSTNVWKCCRLLAVFYEWQFFLSNFFKSNWLASFCNEIIQYWICLAGSSCRSYLFKIGLFHNMNAWLAPTPSCLSQKSTP